MGVLNSLATIRTTWLSRVSHRLAHGEGVREIFQEQLGRFFDLMQQAIQTGNPAWLDSLLDDWVASRTETEVENRENSLPPLLDQILLLTNETAREALEENDALELMAALLPIFTHAFEYTSYQETVRHIEHVSQELEKARATLEKLDRSKSDFIAIAAHELKTPLTLIEGYSEMLREQLDDSREMNQVEILIKGINNGTRRLREIVDDMIDVSMIDNNLLSLNFQPVWINRLLNVLQREFEEAVRERRQVIDVKSFPGSDEMTFGDGERLYQALRNILSNAIKYTPDGGKINVNGRKLPGFIEITITDTGIGIDPQNHNRIFEKFGRLGSVSLHSSGKTKFKGGGPGLGLPIAKGIIEAHGGAIWVESDGYDEIKLPGTTFHVLLPLRKEPPDDRTAKLFHALIESDRRKQMHMAQK